MKFTTIPALLLLAFAMTACPESGQYSAPPPPPAAKPPEPVPKTELEKKIEIEQQLRQQTEARLEKQETTTSRWQTLTLFASVAATLLLIVGTSLGAKARHDATHPS